MNRADVRILADENISPRIITFLRELGIDVKSVKEAMGQAIDDSAILKRAWQEQRFVLTHDSDFGTLAIHLGTPCYGIFYLRPKDQRAENVIAMLDKFLRSPIRLKPGMLIVLDEKRARIRDTIDPSD